MKKTIFDTSDDCISSSSSTSTAAEVGDDKQTIIEEYEKKVNEMKDPNALDFLPLCVANIPLEDKVRVLNKLPDAAYSDIKGMEWLEMQLERAGQGSLAQYMRYWQNYSAYEDDRAENSWCQSVIETDSLMRWIVQRQGYVEEQMEGQRRALRWMRGRAETDLVIAEKLAVWERELIELKKRRWTCKRKQWRLVCDMPYGPVGRAFTALRKDRGWYLSDWLRRDCAGRGGCCGRSCGCCDLPRGRGYNGPEPNYGHCTTACSCCIRHRGFAGDGKFDDMRDFPVKVDKEAFGYSLCVLRAYIWGVDLLNDME